MAPTSKAFVTVLFLSLALCQIIAAEPSLKDDSLAEKIVGAIKQITTLSSNLRKETESITPINAPYRGPLIPQGFGGIITTVAEATIAISSATNANASPLSDDDAKLVVETLTTFVQVHQQLLNVVIGKHGIVTLFPFFAPIRLSLLQLEGAVDSFAFALIDLIPSQESAAKKQFDSLAVTIENSIRTYKTLTSHGNSPVDDIQAAFKSLVQLSDNILELTLRITPVEVFYLAPEVLRGLSSITDEVNRVTAQLAGVSGGNSPFGDNDAKLVVKSLTTFVEAQQVLLSVLIGKHDVATLIPFFQPIRQSLVTLEASVDTLAFRLIKLLPSQKAAAEAQFQNLGTSLKQAEQTFSTPYVTAYV